MNLYPSPYHFDTRDLFLYSAGIFISILAMLCAIYDWRMGGKEEKAVEENHTGFIFFPHIILINCLIFLIVQSFFGHFAPLMPTPDEYSRADFAFSWGQKPFFSTYDHIWLPGQFYIMGALSWLIHDIEKIITLTSILGTTLLCAASTNLAGMLFRNRVAAMVAGLLASIHWMIFWASTSAMAEVFFYPSLLLAANAWVAAWQSSPGDNNRHDRLLLAAAVFNGFGNMFRYESWYFGIPLGMFFCIRFIYRGINFKNHSIKQLFFPLASAFAIAAYPVAHAISSWIDLGSPIAFFSVHTKMNNQTNLFYEDQNLLQKFLNYPRILWEDHWYLLPLALTGLLTTLLSKKRYNFVPYHLGVFVVFLFAMLVSMKSGIGSNTRPRFTTFFVILICIYSGMAVKMILEGKPLLFKWLGEIFLTIFLAILVYTSLYKAIVHYPNCWGLKTDDASLVMRLKLENDLKRITENSPRVQPYGWEMFVYTEGDAVAMWPLRIHAKDARKVHLVWDEGSLVNLYGQSRQNTVLAIRNPTPPSDELKRNYRLALSVRGWEIWHSN